MIRFDRYYLDIRHDDGVWEGPHKCGVQGSSPGATLPKVLVMEQWPRT